MIKHCYSIIDYCFSYVKDLLIALFFFRREVYPLPVHSIGPLIMLGEYYLQLKRRGQLPTRAIFYHNLIHPTVNSLLAEYYIGKLGASLNTPRFDALSNRVYAALVLFRKNSVPHPRDCVALDSVAESETGQDLLRYLEGDDKEGIVNAVRRVAPSFCDEAKIVTIHVRDPGYWKSRGVDTSEFDSFRDMSPIKLSDSLDFLTSSGYFIFQIGSVRDATLEKCYRLDVLGKELREKAELYLYLKSRFSCVTASGGSLIPVVLGVPCLHMNLFPLEAFQGARGLLLPKLVTRAGQFVKYGELVRTFRWHFERDSLTPFVRLPLSKTRFNAEFDAREMKVVECSSEDILEAVREMDALTSGKLEISVEFIDDQDKYMTTLSRDSRSVRNIGVVSPSFMRKYRRLFTYR